MLEVWALFIVDKLEVLASNLSFTMMFQYGKLVVVLSKMAEVTQVSFWCLKPKIF